MSEIRPNDSATTEVSGGAKDKNAKAQSSVTIAVSPRALFNMDKEREIYDNEGLEKCVTYHIDHEEDPLEPGAAFPFVKALMNVNSQLKELYPDSKELFDINLMTRNNAQVGVRLMNSIDHHELAIERFCMTGGRSPVAYLKAYKTNLYLSNDPEKVSEAIKEGIAAATLFMPEQTNEMSDTELRVAFDGDAVLFSDESENIMKESGLGAFLENEKKNKDKTLEEGPLKCFLEALGKLQRKFYAKNKLSDCPIRTFLVTSRGGGPSGVRVLKTLRSWGLEIDEAVFLAGAPKGPLLQVIKPHIFFDDQMSHITGAKELGTVSAHVPYGKHQ